MQLARFAKGAACAAGAFLFTQLGGAQEDPANGVWVSPRGEIRFLLVFAEVDYGNDWENPIWPKGQVPLDADDYFDHAPSSDPSTYMTGYYDAASFGEYKVLADYYPSIVTVADSASATLYEVAAQITAAGPVVTQHGYTVDDLDSWGSSGAGLPKDNTPNGRVDVFFVIWRNHNPNTGKEVHNWAAGKTGTHLFTPIGTASGADVWSTMVATQSSSMASGIIIHEYMHGLFGGNNFHTSSGASSHTLHCPQGTYSMTNHGGVSEVACSWDRQRLGYQHPNKLFAISAGEGADEIYTDISIETHPFGGTFVLRDCLTTGDAIRIKLPHVRWDQLGDPKNQYLWLENRQLLLDRFDVNWPNTTVSCLSRWRPGLYAYVQIGKDANGQDLNGNGVLDPPELSIYGGSYAYPNALAGFLHPLSAEGNHDFYWRLDEVVPPNGPACQWDNWSIPYDKGFSLPNPFTGYNELFSMVDNDLASWQIFPPTFLPLGNGYLCDGELKSTLSELILGSVVDSLPFFGDDQDAFGSANGNTKLGIGTNPAPVPVYTHRSESGFDRPNLSPLGSYENRTIWLNGLSVEILVENVDAEGSMLVQVRWDDYEIENHVRWTGDIRLSNDERDPLARSSEIRLDDGVNLVLDRGLSPTQYEANAAIETYEPSGVPSIFPPGLSTETTRLFTQPTVLTIEAGTRLYLESHATLWVQNGSRLVVEKGAEVWLEPGANLLVGAGGGTLEIHGLVLEANLPNAKKHVKFRVGDADDFLSGDAADRPPQSEHVLGLVASMAAQPGWSPGVDLDVPGSDRPVGLTLYTPLPENSRVTSAILRSRFEAQSAFVFNDVIFYDDSAPTPDWLPWIALRDIIGQEPVNGVVYDVPLYLELAPIRTVNTTGGPGGHLDPLPEEYLPLLTRLKDGHFDAVFGDDVMVDYAQLEVTYVMPDAPLGDLDGDYVLNQDDLDILLRAIPSEAYPRDPRDLDGDRLITEYDARLLTKLPGYTGS